MPAAPTGTGLSRQGSPRPFHLSNDLLHGARVTADLRCDLAHPKPRRAQLADPLDDARLAGGRANLFKTDPDQADESLDVATIVDQLVIRGTVDRVVDQILAFRETIGDFGTLLYAGHDWQDPALARRSMVLMAEQVMPRVNAAIGTTPTS